MIPEGMKTFYKIMEDRFGPPFPERSSIEYWVVENAGWSDPNRPSWFECGRFSNYEDAMRYAKVWYERNGGDITVRIVNRKIEEICEYIYDKRKETTILGD